MLRSFRLDNHRSFAGEQEWLLMPTGRQAAGRVVPVSAVYGANASGKSNLLDGLAFMRDAVVNSYPRWEPGRGVPRHPFRLDSVVRAEPSTFVVELIIDEVSYTYGFIVNDERVLEEWLYSYPEHRRRVLFERDQDDISFGSTLDQAKRQLEALADLNRPDALLLSVAGQSSINFFNPVHDWFREQLQLRGRLNLRATSQVERSLIRYLRANPQSTAALRALLVAADFGIADLELWKNDSLSTALPGAGEIEDEYRIHIRHEGSDEPFTLPDESAGTVSWLALLPVVLRSMATGSVLAVDEIDASLHPMLVAHLVEIFQDPEVNTRSAQLLFTSHDTSLLGTSLGAEVLKREQIWFVAKNDGGKSELYALSDFKPRQDQNTERRYLGGSYGAVPTVDSYDLLDTVRAS